MRFQYSKEIPIMNGADVVVVGGGPAAALAVKESCTVREVKTEELRQVLRGNGAYL